MGDVNQDIKTKTAAINARAKNLGLVAKSVVAAIATTVFHVIMSVESVMVDVKVVILGLDASTHAKPDITEKTVLFNALQVAMERVNIYKGHAKYVKKDGTLNVL